MIASAASRLKAAYRGARRYALRRCARCRKFLGIVVTDAYHIVARTLCRDCYDASVHPRHTH